MKNTKLWLACGLALALAGCAAPGPAGPAGAGAQPGGSSPQAPVKAAGPSTAGSAQANRMVERAGTVWEFRTGGAVMPAVSYQFDGRTYSLDDYLSRRDITSLIVVKDGQIVLERYPGSHKAEERFLTYSVAKSITGLLVGAALERGVIRSLDDTADTYAPELKGSAYGRTTVRNLLQMASGVQWYEVYSGNDDVAALWNNLFGVGGASNPTGVLTRSRKQEAPQGTRFKYSTGDSQALCHVLRGASGKTISELTQEWLWQGLGAEDSAFWLVGSDGLEYCAGGFNARARDYARLARLVSDAGARDGVQVLPRDYVLQATEGSRQRKGFGIGEAGPGFGYGYQFWLGSLGSAMIGVHGQYVGIYRPQNLLIVQTANWPRASDAGWTRERSAFTAAIAKAFAPN